jgi:hypothetical protein
MADLSHWDFAESFYIEEAAELIVGGNPEAILGERSKKIAFSTAAKPVFNRMTDACVVAMLALRGGKNCPPDGLMFLELERAASQSKPRTLFLTILDTMLSTGEEYRVRRAEIARWLSAIGLKSVYRFDLATSNATSLNKEDDKLAQSDKRLATRERDTLLIIIAALCEEAGYDYKKPAKTAGLIQSTATKMGVSIGETTIENHLKKIPDALGSRMK